MKTLKIETTSDGTLEVSRFDKSVNFLIDPKNDMEPLMATIYNADDLSELIRWLKKFKKQMIAAELNKEWEGE